jgi:hypothetical protein
LIVIIMAPKKGTKGAPKRGEKVDPTNPRPKIFVETVNSPDVSVGEVPLKHHKQLLHQQQQQELMLRVQMMKFWSVLTPHRSAQGRKQQQQGVFLKRRD